MSPPCGDYAPGPIGMQFRVLTFVPDVIISAKFYVDSLSGFLEGKVPFPILFGTIFTTVLHYRADCDDIPIFVAIRSRGSEPRGCEFCPLPLFWPS